MDERDWCRENRVPINIYWKYKNQMQLPKEPQKTAKGANRSRYFELPVNRSLEELVDSSKNQAEGKQDNQTARENGADITNKAESVRADYESRIDIPKYEDERNEGVVIQAGGCRLYVKDGISESMLRTVMEVVTQNA